MKLGELKAFIEGMDIPEGTRPTVEQWRRVLEKLGQVTPETKVEYSSAPSINSSRPGIVPLDWPRRTPDSGSGNTARNNRHE